MLNLLSMIRIVPSRAYSLLALLALCIGCEMHGRHAENKKWEAREKAMYAERQAMEAKEHAAQVEATLAKERELRRTFDSITMVSQEKEKNAQAKINKLRSRVAAGAVKLSVRTGSCQPPNSGTGNSEGTAELLSADSLAFIGIAGEADRVVRKLNECIDKYNALR